MTLKLFKRGIGAILSFTLTAGLSVTHAAQPDDFEIDFVQDSAAQKEKKKDTSLDELSFDSEDQGNGEDGLVIIAPGAASPEDSLAAFGIESPFESRRNRSKNGPLDKNFRDEESGTGEAIELGAPETTDFNEKLAVETLDGFEVTGGMDEYAKVERAGAVLTESELRIDGQIIRVKDNSDFAPLGSTVYLEMKEGRQVYPGAEYVVFKERGLVQPQKELPPLGMRVEVTGVIRVIRVDTEWVMARVIALYGRIASENKIRLRDPERQRYLTSLRADRNRLPADMEGELASIKGDKTRAINNDIVYLNFGRTAGAVPGLRFGVYREADASDKVFRAKINPVGRIGLVELISTRLKTSTARVLSMGSPLRVGDKIRYR